MDISTERAQPGPEPAGLAATYSLYSGSNPDSNSHDMLMPEVFIVRFFLEGEWVHRTSPGDWEPAPPAALWGSASKMMQLRCPFPFQVFNIVLRTSAWLELSELPPKDFVDRVIPLESIFGPDVARLHRELREAADVRHMAERADAWLGSLPRCKIRPLLIERAQTFEDFARFHWEEPITVIAEELNLSIRQLERITVQCMGLKPKLLTRRHRFLNVAAALRGVGNAEWQELCYRYYSDQSHMSREFRKFAGMTPGEFRETQAPLLDAMLSFRHATYKILKSLAEQNHRTQGLPINQWRI